MLDKDFLIHQLRSLDGELGPTHHAEIIVRLDDHFDWSSLERCASCTLPGHPHGQERDVRFSTDGADGLHGRYFPDRVEFHLDLADACRALIDHGVKDTRLVPGAIIGGVIGAVVGGARGAAIGAVAGGAIGAQVPTRNAKSFEYRELAAAHFRCRYAT